MRRFRWWLSDLLARWSDRIAPIPDAYGLSLADLIKDAEIMETPLMKRLRDK